MESSTSVEYYNNLPRIEGLSAVKAKGNVYNLVVGDQVYGQAKILRGEHCWAVVLRDYES